MSFQIKNIEGIHMTINESKNGDGIFEIIVGGYVFWVSETNMMKVANWITASVADNHKGQAAAQFTQLH